MSDPPGIEALYANLDMTIHLEELQLQVEQMERKNMLLLTQQGPTVHDVNSNHLELQTKRIPGDDIASTNHGDDIVKADDNENSGDDTEETSVSDHESVNDMTVAELQEQAAAMVAERETFMQTILSLEDRVCELESEIKELECQHDANKMKIQAFEALFCAMNEQAHGSSLNGVTAAKGLPDTVGTLVETECDSSLSSNSDSSLSSSRCGPVEI